MRQMTSIAEGGLSCSRFFSCVFASVTYRGVSGCVRGRRDRTYGYHDAA